MSVKDTLETKDKEAVGDLLHQKAKLQAEYASEDMRLQGVAKATLQAIQDQLDALDEQIEAKLSA